MINCDQEDRDLSFSIRGFLLLSTLSAIVLALIPFSAAAESNRSQKDDEYSFSWLDPEKKIYVLQNRKYLKTGHPVLTVLGGVGFSNPYRNTYNLDGRIGYYFSEAWGIEGFYTLTSNASNSTMEALSQAARNTLPNIREIRTQFGGMVHWVPWYAKINVFNSILYFDWYFGAGLGSVNTYLDTKQRTTDPSSFVQQSMLGVYLSTGHQFHLSQSFLVRLDLTTVLYQAPVFGTSGDSTWYSNFNFGIGIGWKL